MDLSRVRFVLLRTQNPMNLGAVARAMNNNGLSRLSLVDPVTSDWDTARRVAVQSEEVLEQAERPASLEEALAQATWVVGTSMRPFPGQRPLPPRRFAEEAARRTREPGGGEIALVFGGEDHGLSNADLLACHEASAIPTSPLQPSLNLAQAALVYAYELYQASLQAQPAPLVQVEERAPEALLQQVEHALRSMLERSRFTDPDRPGHGVADLAHTLRRAHLTAREAKLWQAVLRRAAAALKGPS